VATAQLYSILYYGSVVWLNNMRSIHYRILRVGIKDYKQKVSKNRIDKACKRATPEMWSKYAAGSLVIKITRDRGPLNLYAGLMENFYTEPRRPNHGRYFDNSRGKIGKHRLQNRMDFMSELGPWLTDPNIENDQIRRLLKNRLNFDFN